MAVACGTILVHLALSSQKRKDVTLVVLSGGIGFIAETALIFAGLVDYRAPWPNPLFAPAWIVALWSAFATLLGVSLSWLQGRLVLAAMVGAPAGSASYYAAFTIGSLSFPLSLFNGLFAAGLIWALTLPVLMVLSERLQRNSS